MAKVKSIIKIIGTIDGVTYYETQDGIIARMPGGFTSEAVKYRPAYVRTRENGKEFGSASRDAKLLLGALKSFTLNVPDNRVSSRLTGVLVTIKKLDTISARGLRTVANGIQSPEALLKLKNFNFNKHALLHTILKKRIVADPLEGTISIADLSAQDIAFPAGATHAVISGAWAFVDFESRETGLVATDVVKLDLNAGAGDVFLSAGVLPDGSGTRFCLVKVGFFQEVNGEEYALLDGGFDGLWIVGVG